MNAQKLAIAVGWAVGAACLVTLLAAGVLGLQSRPGIPPLPATDLFFAIAVASYPLAGAIVVARRPLNPVGWYLLLAGAIYSAGLLAWQAGISEGGGGMRAWLAWFGSWTTFAAPLALLLGLTRFPDGRRVRGRLGWVGPSIVGLGLIVVAVRAVRPGRLNGTGPVNPAALPIELPGGLVSAASDAALLLAVVLVILTLGARYRRSETAVQQQLKWLILGAATLPLGIVIGTAVGAGAVTGSPRDAADTVIYSVGLMGIPVGIAVAMVRHHLYDVDLLISRAIVYLALAAGTTLVYIAFVVVAGYWLGGSSPNLLLSIVATALIAVAFQPARRRVQEYANRLVYGRRLSPHEALGEFVRRVAQTYETDRLVEEMARTIGECTVVESVQIWLATDEGTLRPAAVRPAGPWPEVMPSDASWSLFHIAYQGAALGLIAVRPPTGEALRTSDRIMISDLALHAGLGVRNARLTMALRHQLDELEASRRRLVTAQETERRRIERDLHDGAQQQLIAMRLSLQLAQTETPSRLLTDLLEQADAALAALRELARGIHPAVLSDRGLVAALESATRSAPVRVRIEADHLGRFHPDVESAVYFCCLEAVQNALKHSGSDQVRVTLKANNSRLTFSVEDDGLGLPHPAMGMTSAGLTNMADRAKALGGGCEVRSSESGGTAVEGWVPTEPSTAASRSAGCEGARPRPGPRVG